MVKLNEVYRCSICGNIVEVTHASDGELVCCGQSMKLLEGNTQDASFEKHVPIIKEIDEGYLIKVGSNAHPMDSDHFIEWIELVIDDEVYRQHLEPNDKPEAVFCVTKSDKKFARTYCNMHGLWNSD